MPKIGIEKKNNRKNTIMEHALDIFALKGYADTSIDDIAQMSGTSKGGIYVYFKSKEEIFLSIAEMAAMKRHEIAKNISDAKTHRDKLESYIDNTLSSYLQKDNYKRIKLTFEFWIKHYNKEKIGNMNKQEIINRKFQNYTSDIIKILKDGIKAGEFRKDIDLESIAYIILTSIDGMAFATSLLKNPITQKRIDALKKMISKSVLVGEKSS